MPKPHAAAVRAAQTVVNLVLEGVEGIDAPAVISREYAPLVEAARPAIQMLRDQELHFTANVLERALREVVGAK
jgi:hypothetical protein